LILRCELSGAIEHCAPETLASLEKANGADQEILYPNLILNRRVWAGENLI
jgi:hypothetical protein